MPTALEKAVHDRGSISDTLDFLEKELATHATTPLDNAGIIHYLDMAKAGQTEVMEIHRRIQSCATDMQPHQEEYQKLLSKSSRLIISFTGIRMKIPHTSGSGSPAMTLNPDIRLPKLELPTFKGDLTDWIAFRDMFVAAVHNNGTLSNSQKLTYLKSQLKGEAARQISNMIICDSNYDIAWTQLTDRYQNDRELLFAVMRRFDNQPLVHSHSASGLRQLADVSRECIRSLQVLKLPTEHWDAMLLFYIVKKMDSSSKELWEQGLKDSTIPSLQSLFDFLEQRARALAASGSTNPRSSGKSSNPGQRDPYNLRSSDQQRNVVHHSQSTPCLVGCDAGQHPIFRCNIFLEMSISERYDFIKKIHACFNCFAQGHGTSSCPSKGVCRSCSKKHHTLICRQSKPTDRSAQHTKVVHKERKEEETPAQVHFTTINSSATAPREFDTLLATALVQVEDRFGKFHTFRVLADNGSNTHFATESFVRQLGLPRKRCHTSSTGLGGSVLSQSTGITSFRVRPHFDTTMSFPISKCLVTKKITGKLPSSRFDHKRWSHLQDLQLADPTYHEPQDVDLLLGAEFFFGICKGKTLSGHPNSPVALETSFGWLIGGGSVPLINPQVPLVHATTTTSTPSSSSDCDVRDEDGNLDKLLRKFWEIEAEPNIRLPTKDETAAETHFRSTYSRDASGRFTVKLPMRDPPVSIGSSLKMATKRLQMLEKRLQSNPEARKEYLNFMQEYEKLQHMKEIIPVDDPSSTVCYIPHHFILKESSTTTKFRVVFDASSKTSNGVSLNETMMVGPTIQDSLFEIIMRFRLHKIALVADIAKMYRQIRVTSTDAKLQRILWRDDPTKPIKHYELDTVAYGTAPASFVATRVVQELATLEKIKYPRASKVAGRDLYMDDLMSGEPTVEEAIETQRQLIQLMESGCFNLRKWSSNSEAVLEALPVDLRETKSVLSFEIDSSIKTLGICWNPKSDQFMFKISTTTQPPGHLFTKRMILSEIAKLFDPIGWLAPVIINAKIIMQSLWRLELGWDQPLPENVQQQWISYQQDLEGLNSLAINRFYCHNTDLTCPSLNLPSPCPVKFCLAGFCDASEKAYAAVIYLCVYSGHQKSISLITSKTRVAPAKQVSLPRLELCGAHVLSDLMTSVKKSLRIPIHSTWAFTDSTVTLAWIQSHPSRWKVFVANRVTQIQEQIPPEQWSHVQGDENPADCASRGIEVSELVSHHLWWTGPKWLEDGEQIPRNPTEYDYQKADLEAKPPACHFTIHKDNSTLLDKYSSLLKLNRVTAFALRFIKNCRIKSVSKRKLIPINAIVMSHPLSPIEIDEAQKYWIRIIQKQSFYEEIKSLKQNLPLSRTSKVISLCPFLDAAGVLRVGGRLKHSQLTNQQRHPILLPRHSRLTQLTIQFEHLAHLHAGPQLLMSVLQERYWIIGARDAIRSVIKHCVPCSKQKATMLQQLMGDLPSFRVTPARPFLNTGVDYAGPFQIRPLAPRSTTTIKAYLALFICCTTRAIHLEIVSDCSTERFLAALRRFVARRGKPSNMYSDCGSNFIGANNEMKGFIKLLQSSAHNKSIVDDISKDGISWNFNAPASPHFGGLWESGVKSVKFHLRRIIGSHRLTFEELTTATTQVEAILNSRPLTALSTDPNDLEALTPGHFLIGAPVTSFPDPNLDHLKMNRLSRWQLLQQMVQAFWKRWSNEYLTRLQQRPKWMQRNNNISVGALVTIKDENLPPLKWKLGRVIHLHPGPDSLVRVVTVKTASGELKRPIVKLCVLPIPVPNPTSETASSSHSSN